MKYFVIDSETDGLLLEEISVIHCLSCCEVDLDTKQAGKIFSFSSASDMKKFLENPDHRFICHNIIEYDSPVFNHMLDVDIDDKIFMDTLKMCDYIKPYLEVIGLEYFGSVFRVPKVKIDDWKTLDTSDYIKRCERDVEINTKLFIDIINYLENLYQGNITAIKNLLKFKNNQSFFIRDLSPMGIDLELCQKEHDNFERIFNDFYNSLQNVMPKSLGKVLKTKPKKFRKKNGELSKKGQEWMDYLIEEGLPLDTEEIREEPNPNSSPQLKEWLFSVGWNPCTFKTYKKSGNTVPQITDDGELTESVLELVDKVPELKILESFYVIRHRLGIFKAFLECVDDKGKLKMDALRYTNTWRVRHIRPLANLPKPGKPYAENIRQVIVPPKKEYTMFGADISGLEDKSKQNIIIEYDPEYVAQMNTPDFDPHLNIGLKANFVTSEEVKFYKKIDAIEDKSTISKEDLERYKDISGRRSKSKTGNFAMTYNAFPEKLSSSLDISMKRATDLFNGYWEVNWSIKKAADEAVVNFVGNQMWLFNKYTNMFYFLKKKKDTFSTYNQGYGMYIFSLWKFEVAKAIKDLPVWLCLEYHDEILGYCEKGYESVVSTILHSCMNIVNKKLNLKVPISISVDFGNNYKECH